MPLVRFQVRNEYGLGHAELYREANREDPKAVLDGVAVAGLVGILRQLGDLAEFAAEVFHGLQEQVMDTASRSHNLMVRVQNIEAALPPLEKAVLAQTSHIHFAYTAGSEWHPRIQTEENHFIYNDLPRFIMDSYEECRDPPRLHLLDKFDTGGPGYCLKRYSDPTFFRRISGNFKEPEAEKLHKDKKCHKSKKKRSSQRNGDFLRSASTSNHSNRLHATTAIVNGRSSPSHTTSTIDMALKSDLGDRSNSFDSRTGSGHVECVFHLNSSVPPEQEHGEFSSRFMHNNDTSESFFPEEQSGIADESLPCSSSPEPIVPISSCVTWDEKAEIVERKSQHSDEDVERKSQHSDEDEAPDMPTTHSDLDTQGMSVANIISPDQMDVLFDDKSTSKLSASRNHLDEVESEPDNFMDALNTIESESENDLDCQTKHEVEQISSNVIDLGREDGIHEVTAQISDHYSARSESHPAFDISSNEEMLHDSSKTDPSRSITSEQTANISGKSTNLDYSLSPEGSKNADAFEGSKVESVISGPLSSFSGISNLQEPLNNNTVSHSFKPQESQAQFSGVQSVTFWTNGGLLGLQPSKPPDFGQSKVASQDFASRHKGEAAGPQNRTFMSNNDGELEKHGATDAGDMERVSNSKCFTSWDGNQDPRVEKFGHAKDNVSLGQAHGGGLNLSSAVAPVNELPLDDVRATSIDAKWENDNDSPQLFGLGRRLLANGFHRKMPHVTDSKPDGVSVLEQRSVQHGFTYQATLEKESNGQFGHRSTIYSRTSSPPLELMKISFHPMDDFGLSKLKLKFPDGNHSNESIRDTFPSFQLVPEPAVPLHDVGSDSDDDTFCRSSPYLSDACRSYHTESDSEQWECSESPEQKDHELYDALCSTSSVDSAPFPLQSGEAGNNGIHTDRGFKSLQSDNGLDSSLSASLLDFPSFDDMNPVLQRGRSINLEPMDFQELQYLKESAPLPPPLPPVQWMVLKPDSDVAESKQHDTSEAYEHAFDLKCLGVTLSQLPKSARAQEQQINQGAIAVTPGSKQVQQKLSWPKEAEQPVNDRGVDEKEDFLHQIRTKSFTLRRTVTAKPSFSSGRASSDKVTAILEKANAIRQAVGSDDGDDDDNWSDT